MATSDPGQKKVAVFSLWRMAVTQIWKTTRLLLTCSHSFNMCVLEHVNLRPGQSPVMNSEKETGSFSKETTEGKTKCGIMLAWFHKIRLACPAVLLLLLFLYSHAKVERGRVMDHYFGSRLSRISPFFRSTRTRGQGGQMSGKSHEDTCPTCF